MRNKLRNAISAATVAALTLPALAMAQFNATDTGAEGAGLTEDTVGGILEVVLNWFLMLIGILAVLAFVIAGIMYITAAGDETRIDTAKKTMTYAIIGLVVALIGLLIVRLVAYMVGAEGGIG